MKHSPLPAPEQKILAIFCDIGNVLIRFWERGEWLWHMAKLVNPGIVPDGIPEKTAREKFLEYFRSLGMLAKGKTGGDAQWPSLETGRVPLVRLYHAFVEAAGTTCDEVPQERFWFTYGNRHRIIPETCELVRALRRPDRVLIAATDGDSLAAADLVQMEGNVRWDGVVLSGRIGCMKPRDDFYLACRTAAERALSRRAVMWHECLYIDDVHTHVESYLALTAGHAICFDATRQPAAQLRTQLQDYGVFPPAGERATS
ncbi:MAG: hypothetical protein PHI63_03250 [Patescibacteria group bacterium]|nr:hypothetical protein [Patescibacteria group bacterium]